jgi:RING-type zinc-finger
LSFKIQHKEIIPSRIIKPAPKTVSDITLSPYYRFAVSPGDYSLYSTDPNMFIPWDLIKKITFLADSEIKCPICLETDLLAGRANKCGHCYCWPCIIKYMWINTGSKRCPVCNDSLRAADLRPVSVNIYRNISEGDCASFMLIRRPKRLITLFKRTEELEKTCMGILKSDSLHAHINKISIYTQANQDYLSEKSVLLQALNTTDELEKPSIQRALDVLEKQYTQTPYIEFNTDLNPYGFYYFYQLHDTQPYFLHPLNISMLKKQLCEYESFPVNLQGKIIEIERIHITEHEQKKYG